MESQLKLPKSTVLDIWKKYKKSGNTNNKQRSGRPSLTKINQIK